MAFPAGGRDSMAQGKLLLLVLCRMVHFCPTLGLGHNLSSSNWHSTDFMKTQQSHASQPLQWPHSFFQRGELKWLQYSSEQVV